MPETEGRLDPVIDIPLFPLNTVLVPGGKLPLRIFEQRYLDMIRECSGTETGFGVCLLVRGSETGPAEHVRVGTQALIRDFYTLDDGLLGITAEGASRFIIQTTRVRDNGLLVGEVEWLEEPRPTQVPVAHAVLSHIAEQFMEQLEDRYPEFHPRLLQDAGWVGYRLTEWLPLETPDRQVLLEMDDPVERLQRLLEIIPSLREGPGDE
jgi:Lon protease-like protein